MMMETRREMMRIPTLNEEMDIHIEDESLTYARISSITSSRNYATKDLRSHPVRALATCIHDMHT